MSEEKGLIPFGEEDHIRNHLSQVSGDDSVNYQAGRDLIVETTINYEQRTRIIKSLVQMYRDEKQESRGDFAGYIRALERFTTSIDGDLKDLKTKLTDGGCEYDYEWALQLKEEYAKLLQQNKFSNALQNIHAYLLARVLTLYNQFVLPEIKKGKDQESIKTILNEMVIYPIEELVGGPDNVLSIFATDINGMLYYLTGNCHIKWC